MLGSKNPLKNLPQISDFLIKVALYINNISSSFTFVSDSLIEQFSITCRKYSEIVFVLLNFHYDWLRKLARSFRPIRCKTKNNRDFVIRVFFPALRVLIG